MPEESYCSYDEARQIIAALNICTAGQYRSRYKEHAGLPSNPPIFFAGKGWDCWYVFLSKAKPDLYESLSQAQIAARFLGISTQLEYVARYKEDSRLPSDPVRFYDECKSWRHFFQEDYEKAYPTYEEAKSAARRLGMLRSTCRAAAASCNFPGTYSVIGRKVTEKSCTESFFDRFSV
ncbi:hypothetical protein G7032_29595, partial [Pseudomonas monteilii]|uniref:integrase repeat-containing protein n=1 Tax=Pseudomonas monteilii TaxID=76759 RepID=UPI001C613488